MYAIIVGLVAQLRLLDFATAESRWRCKGVWGFILGEPPVLFVVGGIPVNETD